MFNTLKECNSVVSRLNLSYNELDDEYMIQIGEYLQDNKYVEVLGLTSNKVTDKGVEILSEHLIGNTTLKELYLFGNKGITDASVPHLIEMVKKSCITNMNLDRTSVCEEKQQQINQALSIPIEQREHKNRPNVIENDQKTGRGEYSKHISEENIQVYLSYVENEATSHANHIYDKGMKYLKDKHSPIKDIKFHRDRLESNNTQKLMDKVKRMNVIIVLLSKSYLTKMDCLFESYVAIKYGIPIIPVSILENDFDVTKAKEYFKTLSDNFFNDLYPNDYEFWDRLGLEITQKTDTGITEMKKRKFQKLDLNTSSDITDTQINNIMDEVENIAVSILASIKFPQTIKILMDKYEEACKIPLNSISFNSFMESPIMKIENDLIWTISKLLMLYKQVTNERKEEIKAILNDKEFGDFAIKLYEKVYIHGKEYFEHHNEYYGKYHIFLSHAEEDESGIFSDFYNFLAVSSNLNVFLDVRILQLCDSSRNKMIFAALTCDIGFSFISEDYFFHGKTWSLREYYILQTRCRLERHLGFKNIPMLYTKEDEKKKEWTGEALRAPLPGILERGTGMIFSDKFECDNVRRVIRRVFDWYLYERYTDIKKPKLLEDDPSNLSKLGLIIPYIKQNEMIDEEEGNELNEEEGDEFLQKINGLIENDNKDQIFVKCGDIDPAYLALLIFANNKKNINNHSKWGWRWWIDCKTEETMKSGLESLCDSLNIPNKIDIGRRIEHLISFMRSYTKRKPYMILFFGLNKRTLDSGLFNFRMLPPDKSKIVVISNDNEIRSRFERIGYKCVPNDILGLVRSQDSRKTAFMILAGIAVFVLGYCFGHFSLYTHENRLGFYVFSD